MKKIFLTILSSAILALIFSLCSFAAETSTILTRDNEKIKCTVSLSGIDEGSVIVVTGIRNGRSESFEMRTVEENDTETFYVSSLTKMIKVFVFENTTNLSPVTEGETKEIELDSITDPDWSEWV